MNAKTIRNILKVDTSNCANHLFKRKEKTAQTHLYDENTFESPAAITF
jgi:hypothetical protein